MSAAPPPRRSSSAPTRWVLALLLVLAAGCRTTGYLARRGSPESRLNAPLQLASWNGPQATPRTQSLLRRYALLTETSALDPATLKALGEEIVREPTLEKVHAYAELAYVQGSRAAAAENWSQALDLFGSSVAHAYAFLFDPVFDDQRNPYDPQFRAVCDLYNGALEAGLRIFKRTGRLVPGGNHSIQVGSEQFECEVVVRGRWEGQPIERIEFVSDYKLEGLKNRHIAYGLGVPVIAVRGRPPENDPREQFYPPMMSLPMTLFLRVEPVRAGQPRRIKLELYDPLQTRLVQIDQRQVPLETDISTPLAFALDCPALQERRDVATTGFLNPSEAERLTGLFMLEPYDPNRIPVIMVHGLLSSPLTWMEMFNDLRSFPDIQQRYQFWFYLYPTGQPFPVSARQLRESLAQAIPALDPHHRNPHMNQLVLVGHSMGGLLSRLQVSPSGDRFWRAVSDKPFQDVAAEPERKQALASVLFFEPNPAVRRVVTIGTPHRGSEVSNKYTQWLGRRLIRMPRMVAETAQELLVRNPDLFRDRNLMQITSVDALAPDSPFILAMNDLRAAPWVVHHNVAGAVKDKHLLQPWTNEDDEPGGDGVVSLASARMESAATEIVVPAEHTTLHQHPRTILEVRRILREHARSFEVAMQQQGMAPYGRVIRR